MAERRIVSVVGLAFGDCGKGLFTDYLCRARSAHSVVRYNGGGQAGHNVVLPDGRHHTFSQFGAATFVPGVLTVLAAPAVVHPTALLVEEAFLRRAGVADAFARLLIDGRCAITTPYHEAAGRLRERWRGGAAHGSCGMGFGETVSHALAHPDQAIRYADLGAGARLSTLRAKLEAVRECLRASLPEGALEGDANDAAILADPELGDTWLVQAMRLPRLVPPAGAARIAARLSKPGSVVMEGAQGMLLDEWHGFHPHTTWSSTGPAGAQAALACYGLDEPITHLGAMRSYLTRHGQGPLPTADARLALLAEPHNHDAGWQGSFRRGHPDMVLLRYALAAAQAIDGLLVSHLDALTPASGLRWAHAYRIGEREIDQLAPSFARELAYQRSLCQLLAMAQPCYSAAPIAGPEAFVEEVAALAGIPVRLGAHGPTHLHVRDLKHQ